MVKSEELNIVVVAGTTREKRMSIHAARMVKQVGDRTEGVKITFVDVKDFFPLPGEGNDQDSQDPNWIEINKQADGYFLVVPEYNHSFPGSLKMLLDNDLGNYTHKPVALAGVSAGPFGGARVIENLLSPLRELGMIVSHKDVYFPNIHKMFPDTETEESEQLRKDQIERIQKAYEELIWLAKRLKN
ncbi:MAG: NADPH-dependent FMN reductase [Candidatus Dojkabacteria bacterium]